MKKINKYLLLILVSVQKLFYKKTEKKLDINEVISIIRNCRLLGVQEMVVDGVLARFSSTPTSKNTEKTPCNSPKAPDVKSDTTPLLRDKDTEMDYDIMMLVNPSGFMESVEKGEVNLADESGSGFGEDIS